MDNQEEPQPVVVGVDGAEDNLGALRYATAQAADRGAALQLVHVVPDYLPVSPMMPKTPADLAQAGASILEEAAARVAELSEDVRVEGWLRHGTRSVQLAEAAADAAMLVVGRDEHPLVERLFRGDTAAAVAARSAVPVIEVPASWTAAPRGRIVAGLKAWKGSPALLADAFEQARRTGAKLVVLHAWKLPTVYDDIIEGRVDLDQWATEAVSDMKMLVRDWREVYPEVDVELRVVHGNAGRELVEASRHADLLVLARREHGFPAAVHLGSTARVVLRAAHCPVRVVPPSGPVPPLPLAVEEHGELAR